MTKQEIKDRIRDILMNEDLCAEAMVTEIEVLLDNDDANGNEDVRRHVG